MDSILLLFTIEEVLNEENKIIGYKIVGPDDKVLSTNPSVFPSYDEALSYLIEIIENELNKLKIIREKTIISKGLIIKNKNDDDLK
ncbi:hypothetical protein [Brenneria tiliae]|uniref:Uncharacterized protein n=1 Tax=Brenneria tiliae TaxID=2914984 RepID=A0ABT0MTQ8_9GAMM|nr:hypothetical protein [Brenneria tiliae]MCL2893208.1 hypothetical protein [Brenneria tiliae]